MTYGVHVQDIRIYFRPRETQLIGLQSDVSLEKFVILLKTYRKLLASLIQDDLGDI